MYASQCETVPGELIGVRPRKTFYTDALGPGGKPYGMMYVPAQGYQSGGGDDVDIMGLHTAQKKTVSIQAFYMDATEISNNEYRQFVHWVRDSIAREKLYHRSYGDDAERWISVPDNFFREPYRTFIEMGSDLQGGNTPFQLFRDSTNNAEIDKSIIRLRGGSEEPAVTPKPLVNGHTVPLMGEERKKKGSPISDITMTDAEISAIMLKYSDDREGPEDWVGDGFDMPDDQLATKLTKLGQYYNPGGRVQNRKYFTLNWEEPIQYDDAETQLLLSDMYLPKVERFNNRKEIDTRLLFYDYYWIDYQEAARRGRLIGNKPNARENYKYNLIDNAGVLDSPPTDRNENYFAKSRREPLGKDYKSTDKHRVVVDANGNIFVDTTTYMNQWNREGDNVDGEANEIGTGYELNNQQYSGRALENPGQDLDLGYTNAKGQHNAIRGHTDRQRFIIKESINVYPDTLCWARDFTYSFHDPMTQNYFWHTAYDNYPVVGVTWTQAKAFSVWRTQIYHTWLHNNDELYVNDFRLPTESEWEGAARGDLDMSPYPWGGPYIRNSNGCFLANFKPMRGRYFEDGGFHTVKVFSYQPNAYGLYCMAGNVAEWCATTFDESQYEFGHDMNSNYDYQALDWDHPVKKRKVIRGGSWKDIGYYLQNGHRTYEYQDSAKSYIGFRNVMTHLGRGGKDLEKETGEEIQSDIQLK